MDIFTAFEINMKICDGNMRGDILIFKMKGCHYSSENEPPFNGFTE